jgi:hypothetical protein
MEADLLPVASRVFCTISKLLPLKELLGMPAVGVSLNIALLD